MFLSKPGMFSLPKLLPIPMYSWRKTYITLLRHCGNNQLTYVPSRNQKKDEEDRMHVFKVHNLVKEDLTDNNEDDLEATMTCSCGKVIRRKYDRCDFQKMAGT